MGHLGDTGSRRPRTREELGGRRRRQRTLPHPPEEEQDVEGKEG